MDAVSVSMAVKPTYPGDDLSIPRYPSYGYEPASLHAGVSNTHMPLAEAPGNHQSMSNMMAYNDMCNISSMAPPMQPSLSNTSMNAMSVHGMYTHRPSVPTVRHDSLVPLYSLHDAERNPVYQSMQFRQYRLRQDQRQDKEAAIWPPELENPFLDALLLIPIMGRKKYFMRQQQYGRNMLIGDYVWIAYTMGLAPGQTPDVKNMKRSRKQISSHIQVLKNFFKYHRYFHFFFPARDKETGKKVSGAPEVETIEAISLKNNPVLVALSEGRFPDVRPNYDYFAQLLDQDAMVTVRPKTCHIFVSSNNVIIGPDKVLRDRETGAVLNVKDYPQLAQNLEGDSSRARYNNGSTVMHEYTRVIGQKESDTLKELVRGWEKTAPQIAQDLDLPKPQDEAHLTIIEMSVTMELHRTPFPAGSELNGLMEMSINAALLQGAQLECVTRLSVPRELWGQESNDSGPIHFDGPVTEKVGIQYEHQQNCPVNPCDCMARMRGDIRIPFPVTQWASIVTKAASHQRARETEGRTDGPSVEQLVARTVMTQELWTVVDGLRTRHALIMWRFNGVFKPRNSTSRHDVSASTSWRFLTVNDPTSDYHQQRAYIGPHQAGAVSMQRSGTVSSVASAMQRVNSGLHDGMGGVWPQAPTMRSMGSISSNVSLETVSDTMTTALAAQTPPPPQSGLYHAPSAYAGHPDMTNSLLSSTMSNHMDGTAAPGIVGDLSGSMNDNSHSSYMSSVVHPSFNGSVCEPALSSWNVPSGLENWAPTAATGPGSGGASPYEPTSVVDNKTGTWIEASREAENFWAGDQQRQMWAPVAPGSSDLTNPQTWGRDSWNDSQRVQSFEKTHSVLNPLTTALGKRRRDDNEDVENKPNNDYKRMSLPVVRPANRDVLSEVSNTEW